MQGSAAVKIQAENGEKARVVGLVPLEQLKRSASLTGKAADAADEDDFLTLEAAAPWGSELLARQAGSLAEEAEELLSAARWEDMIALLYPLEEKVPELVAAGLHHDISIKAAFALDHLGRFEEALGLLGPLCGTGPENYLAHYNYAYVAYNALYNSKNRKILLHHSRKRELMQLAHRHFQICQGLRPEAVTPFYREGVLYQDIENNPGKAMICFGRAIANWESLTVEKQETRHQERPKYVRALYHLAGCCLSRGQAGRARTLYERVLREDEDRNFIAPIFKYYSLGKVLHELGKCEQALDYLETAAKVAGRDNDTDFVYERAARCALELGRPQQAAEYINRIPPQNKRHYVYWTEADVMSALGRRDQAKQILVRSAEKDRRSRHRALLGLARISYQQNEIIRALDYADRANKFCLETFGNEGREITFWQAACLYRLGRHDQALGKISELRAARWSHPHLGRLEELVRRQSDKKNERREKA